MISSSRVNVPTSPLSVTKFHSVKTQTDWVGLGILFCFFVSENLELVALENVIFVRVCGLGKLVTFFSCAYRDFDNSDANSINLALIFIL